MFYRVSAFLRDLEKCDIMLRVLNPISGLTFNLATNAAVLNTWTPSPLMLSGIWFPANEPDIYPIMAATDIASTFKDTPSSLMGIEIPQTPLSDQMFDLVINGTPETDFIEKSNSHDWPKTEITTDDNVNLGAESPPEVQEINTSNLVDETIVIDDNDLNGNSDSVEASNKLKNEDNTKEIREELNKEVDPPKENEELIDRNTAILDPFAPTPDGEALSRSTSLYEDTNEYNNLLSRYETSEPEPSQHLPEFLTKVPSSIAYANNSSGTSKVNCSFSFNCYHIFEKDWLLVFKVLVPTSTLSP